jgi:hypothetical protein
MQGVATRDVFYRCGLTQALQPKVVAKIEWTPSVKLSTFHGAMMGCNLRTSP